MFAHGRCSGAHRQAPLWSPQAAVLEPTGAVLEPTWEAVEARRKRIWDKEASKVQVATTNCSSNDGSSSNEALLTPFGASAVADEIRIEQKERSNGSVGELSETPGYGGGAVTKHCQETAW